jgi:hypothetical protein
MACLIVSRQYTLAESGQLQACNSLLSSEKQYASPSPLGNRVTDPYTSSWEDSASMHLLQCSHIVEVRREHVKGDNMLVIAARGSLWHQKVWNPLRM